MKLTQGTSTYTGNRVYYDEQGCRYASISTLAGLFFGTYSLYRWNLKLGKQIAAEQGLVDLSDRELYLLGKVEGDRICKESADLGTAVHLSVETGEPSGNPEYDSYYEQYKIHIAPYLEIHHQEIVLGHVTPEGYRMAGTCDLIGKWGGELIIGDWKTSLKSKKATFMGRYALQLAAYSQSYESNTDTGIVFNLTPNDAHIFHIPLELPKQVLLDRVLPAFYRFYQTPEPRGYPNAFEGMGAFLQQFEKQLTKTITVE